MRLFYANIPITRRRTYNFDNSCPTNFRSHSEDGVAHSRNVVKNASYAFSKGLLLLALGVDVRFDL